MMEWRKYQRLQKVMVMRSDELESGERFVSYVDQGEGLPVVLLHGIPTWGYLWAELIPELSRSYRVLVPDLLGFGYSDKSDRFDRSIDAQAAFLDEWLERLGIESAVVVGHDLGGGVALRWAVEFPDRLNGICLLNSISYDSWPIELMLQLGHPRAHRAVSARALRILLRRVLRGGCRVSPPEAWIEGLLAPYSTEVGKLSLIRNASALNTNLTQELAPRLGRLGVPTLVLWGEQDRFQKVEYGKRLAWDIPRSRFVASPRARHFVMFDEPRQTLEELTRFLESLEPQRAIWAPAA